MFASMIRLQAEPAALPAEDGASPVLAVIKVAGLTGLLVAGGTLVYIIGKRRRA